MRLETFISFAVGATLGATVSYFVTRNIERKRADEEIQAYKDHVDKRIRDLEEKLNASNTSSEASDVVLSKSEEQSIEELSKKVDAAVDNYQRTRKRIENQAAMTVEEAEETEDPELIEAAEWVEKRNKMLKENYISGKDGSPDVIDQLTYTGEGEGEYTYESTYEHISLDWYAGDGVLAYGHKCEIDGEEHEMGEIVEKPHFVVGWAWKQHFGDKELHNDDDCVYVRNELLCCDFEIIRDAGSYREQVLHIYDDEEGEVGGSTEE